MPDFNLKKCPVPFGMVPNSLLNDNQISLKAKGLFAFMQSKPEGWNFSVKMISKQTKDGIDSVSEGLKELENIGFLERKKVQTGKGFSTSYYLYFESILNTDSNNEKSNLGKSNIGKSNLVKSSNNSNKEESKKEESKKEVIAETAFNFFKNNYQESYESLMMQFKNQIKDFDYFLNMFNATCEQEKIPYEQNAVSGRFKRYAFMWISNQSKYDVPVIELNAVKQKIKCF